MVLVVRVSVMLLAAAAAWLGTIRMLIRTHRLRVVFSLGMPLTMKCIRLVAAAVAAV